MCAYDYRNEISQREYFDYYPVTGALVIDAQQYSIQVTTAAQNTDKEVLSVTYEPHRKGVLKEVEFSIPVYLQAVGNTPNAKITVKARDKSGTWVTVMALSSAIATSTTEIVKVVQGRFPPEANFD
ncbi:MAG: hypothetical protein PHE50_08280, partial [Dehalococcoidales bacterium]|nr:hypothetical protein [Dehalococcoidales bacterium]